MLLNRIDGLSPVIFSMLSCAKQQSFLLLARRVRLFGRNA